MAPFQTKGLEAGTESFCFGPHCRGPNRWKRQRGNLRTWLGLPQARESSADIHRRRRLAPKLLQHGPQKILSAVSDQSLGIGKRLHQKKPVEEDRCQLLGYVLV